MFAQDQVAPLPAPAEPVPLAPPIHPVHGEELAPALPRLYALAREIGWTVAEQAMSDHTHGYLDPDQARAHDHVPMLTNPIGRYLAALAEDRGTPAGKNGRPGKRRHQPADAPSNADRR